MDEVYINAESLKSRQREPEERLARSRSSESCCRRYAPLWLGLLSLTLLTGLVVVSVYYHLSVAELFTIRANLTERLLVCSKERDLLNSSLDNTISQLKRLRETCQPGWMRFGSFCYIFLIMEIKTWEASQQSCRQAGADLAVIDSFEEQKFLSQNMKDHTWIGLNDMETEGTWKWIDGSPLTLKYWIEGQPDSGDNNPIWGDEDCAYLRHDYRTNFEGNWNDISCNYSFHAVCKKKLGSHWSEELM